MGTNMPYGITQCYLLPGRGDIPAFTPAEAGTQFSDLGGMPGWVDPGGWLEMVYPRNGHPLWTNRARCWLTSLMQPTTLTTTPYLAKVSTGAWYTGASSSYLAQVSTGTGYPRTTLHWNLALSPTSTVNTDSGYNSISGCSRPTQQYTDFLHWLIN